MHPELLVRKRIWLMTLVLAALFLLVIGRIATLTIRDAEALTQRGVSQWTKAGTVTARRGSIVDRYGQVLAMSTTAYTVTADPRLVKDVDAFLDALDPILPLDRETAAKKLSDRTKGSVILKRQVNRSTVDLLRTLRREASQEACLSALSFDEDVCRTYPYGALLSQVLGLTNIDSQGQSGLESQYDAVLSGMEGSYLRQVDARNRVLPGTEGWYIPSQEGSTLQLTIDATIQEIAEKAMRECVEVNSAESVVCIVSDVRTGGILALCIKPDYDPNDPPRADVGALTELMRITAISDVYEPGSTFKIITAASALDSGATTPEDSFYCSAKIKVDGDTIRCWGRPHGAETMAEGLKNSCNPVFVELALRMGKDTFYRYLNAFGLGKKTGIDLPGESGGILIGSRYVKTVDLARIGFGQSVAVTPLQLAMACNAAINGGKLMKPHIVSEIQDEQGQTIQRFNPTVVSTPIRAETSQTLRGLLEKVVSEGGGKNAYIDGYRIGGKTGTAQVYKDGKIVTNVHIGSFYGFAPADDPLISVLVVVKEAHVPVDYGGTTAAPFARQILEEALPLLGVEKFAETAQNVTVPDIKGLTISQARRTLAEAGLEMLDDGANDVVLDQLPPPGATLKEGGHVMAYTAQSETLTPETLVCVPALNGLSDVDCARLLRQRGLLLSMAGTGLCVRQTPAAGEYVAPGTSVHIILEDTH
ncbi:MAG: penicillin-binding transpeptidase domain-containing protein [Clostridiales bacterium]|nr:penicillin-binding transpeptidase domain-containing protein [Clostridiales bacterium]